MKKTFPAAIARFWKYQEGATMVEYGLMLTLIAAVCVGAVTLLGGNVSNMFTQIAGSL